MTDPDWVVKIKPLVERDQMIRDVLHEKGILNDAYHSEMEKVHIENARKLEKLIEKKGFPSLSNAGEEGVKLSWLIIQHAISLPDFMRSCLQEMRLAAGAQDYPLELIAYTEDRIAFFEGREQLFGTHLDWKDGELSPTPIADPALLNSRRHGHGLGPMSQAFQGTVSERPPKDPVQKAKEFASWLKKTGWRP